MKVTLTVTKESRILKKDLDIDGMIDGMVKTMFKRAKRVGEDEIRFWEDSYVRVSSDEYSYLYLNKSDWFKNEGAWLLQKRSEEDIIYILKQSLWMLQK